MTGIVLLYVLFGSDEEARTIGRDMVERRLAACVNVIGQCHSIYRWKSEIEEAAEVAAIFKTSAEKAERLAEAIRTAHGYDVPAIVTLGQASTHEAYREWLFSSVVETGPTS